MHVIQRYAPSMRLLHWLRAILIIGLIGLGWTMTFLPETDLERFTWMYPVHKEFGVLAFIVGIVVSLLTPEPAAQAGFDAKQRQMLLGAAE